MEATQTQVKQYTPPQRTQSTAHAKSSASNEADKSKGNSFLETMAKVMQREATGEKATAEQLNAELETMKQLDEQISTNAATMGMQMMAEMFSGSQQEVTDISIMVDQITDAALQKAGLPTSADISEMQELYGVQQGATGQGIQGLSTEQMAAFTEQFKAAQATPPEQTDVKALTSAQMELLLAQQQQIVASQQASIGQQTPADITQPQSLFPQEDLLQQPTAVTAMQGTVQAPVQKAVLGVQTSKAEPTEPTESEPMGSMKFGQAVMQAQKMLSTKAGEEKGEGETDMQEEPKKFDVDALQEKVNAGKSTGGAAQLNIPVSISEAKLATVPELPSAEEILAQVKTGLTTGVESGKKEFVIKLKPEGLGEITVRLTEVGSRMSLSITASNTQTQRLISGEMAGLREVMRPMGIEVEATASQDGGHFQSQQHSEFGAGEFGAQQEQQGRQPNRSSYSYTAQNDAYDEPEEQELRPIAEGLNAYI